MKTYNLTVLVQYQGVSKYKVYQELTRKMAIKGAQVWLAEECTAGVLISSGNQKKAWAKIPRPNVDRQPPFWNHYTWINPKLSPKDIHRLRTYELKAIQNGPNGLKYTTYELPVVLKDGTVWIYRNDIGQWQRASQYECEPPEPFSVFD